MKLTTLSFLLFTTIITFSQKDVVRVGATVGGGIYSTASVFGVGLSMELFERLSLNCGLYSAERYAASGGYSLDADLSIPVKNKFDFLLNFGFKKQSGLNKSTLGFREDGEIKEFTFQTGSSSYFIASAGFKINLPNLIYNSVPTHQIQFLLSYRIPKQLEGITLIEGDYNQRFVNKINNRMNAKFGFSILLDLGLFDSTNGFLFKRKKK